MKGLFQFGDFTLSSGQKSHWKIECDALTEDDWKVLAWLSAHRAPNFGSVVGVPRGGLVFAREMERYATSGPRLVVDDVFTTGRALATIMKPGDNAFVAFARNRPPKGIGALFMMDRFVISAWRPLPHRQDEINRLLNRSRSQGEG